MIEMENKNQKVPVQEKIKDIFTTKAIIDQHGDLFEKFCLQNDLDWPAEFARRFGPTIKKKKERTIKQGEPFL